VSLKPDLVASSALAASRAAEARGELAPAMTQAEVAWRSAQAALGEYPDDPRLGRLAAVCGRQFGNVMRASGDYPAADELLLAALELAERFCGPADVEIAWCCTALGVLGKYAGRFDDAERFYYRALPIIEDEFGVASSAAATIWHNLGGLEHSRGNLELGESLARRAVEIRRRTGPEPAIAADVAAHAALLADLGRLDEAAAGFRDAVAIFEVIHGHENYEIAVNQNNLGVLEARRGNHAEAARLLSDALTIKERVLGPDSPELGGTLVTLYDVLARTGRAAEASVLLDRAVSLTASLDSRHPVRRAIELRAPVR